MRRYEAPIRYAREQKTRPQRDSAHIAKRSRDWHAACSSLSNQCFARMPMNSPVIRLEHRQHQALTPRLQHAVRLLQLSSLDFAQEVQAALGKNPFLEVDEA